MQQHRKHCLTTSSLSYLRPNIVRLLCLLHGCWRGLHYIVPTPEYSLSRLAFLPHTTILKPGIININALGGNRLPYLISLLLMLYKGLDIY